MKKVFLMLAVVAMASCSKSELTTRPEVAGDVEIKAGSTVLAIETKVPYVDVISSTNKLTAYVMASTTADKYLSTDATSWWGDGTMEFDGTNVASFSPNSLYYPANKTQEVYLVGLVPSDKTKWTPDNTNGAYMTCAIDGCTDIMTAPKVTTKKADIIVVSPATPTYQTLAFSHVLTKLDVSVVAENQAAIDAWGDITEIQLINEKNNDAPKDVCKVTFNGNAVTFETSASATGKVPFYGASEASSVKSYTDTAISSTDKITLTTTETFAAYSIVGAVSISSGDVMKLNVVTTKLPGGYTVPVTLKNASAADFTGSTAGNQFNVTLKFKASEIKANGSVTDWTANGDYEASIE